MANYLLVKYKMERAMTERKPKWWQSAVFYQIYPRSFADGNGDGIGDFKGMIEKLDYLKDLGIDAIWLSPHFPSPYVDCGYDVADYRGVAPEYGTLKDFKSFLHGAHARNIRVVLDLVLNHTSDQHPWFIESRSSKTNPKRDWYIWKSPKNGQPPTNWYSTFGGSAWELDPLTNEYYYHYFFKEQPDLNWKNPQVQEAMFNEARFWLDMGVDGFRLDAVGTIFEDERYEDRPEELTQELLFKLSQEADSDEKFAEVYKCWQEVFYRQVDQPQVHQVTRALRKMIDEYEDRVLIGETDDISFYGDADNELHLNFNFPLMRTSHITAAHVNTNQSQRLAALPAWAWPCNTFGNHDSARAFSNYGDGQNNALQARLYLMLLLTLKGTPFLYNGEEIGMSDYAILEPKKFRDPLSTLFYGWAKSIMGMSEGEAAMVGAMRGRDKCRTPMQWGTTANGGFSPAGVAPWLPVNPDFSNGVNVDAQLDDPNSLLSFYKEMLQFRKQHPALALGEYIPQQMDNPDVLYYHRKLGSTTVYILLNMSGVDQKVELHLPKGAKLALATVEPLDQSGIGPLTLLPYQGAIFSD
jgi:alpha-glucosidase